jgi:uncharacterized membrane protein
VLAAGGTTIGMLVYKVALYLPLTRSQPARPRAVSYENRDELSDKDKIDRAAWRDEARFLKKQQWAIATAGVLLLAGLLAAIRNMHLTALDRFLGVVLIAIGVYVGWLFLDDLQYGLVRLRRSLDPTDRDATIRGREILHLLKFILVVSALVVAWAVLFKLP